jgi:hypothetical protein
MSQRVNSIIAVSGVPFALAAAIFGLSQLLTAPLPLSWSLLAALLGLHLFSSVLAAELFRLRMQRSPTLAQSAWKLALVLALLLPLVGLLIISVLTIRPPNTPTNTLETTLSPAEERKMSAEGELAREADQQAAGPNIEAIGDALKDSEKEKRLGAVNALRKMENRQAVEMLGLSLQNTLFEVRFHAVEALAGIAQKHSQKIGEMTRVIEEDPSEENHGKLGGIYFEYAELDMEESSIQEHLYRNAVVHLQQSITKGQRAPGETAMKIGLCALKLDALADARAALQTAAEDPQFEYQAQLSLANIAYRSNNFARLRALTRNLLQHEDLNEEHREALTYWSERGNDAY